MWRQRADVLQAEYADAVVAAGGVPVLLPPASADPDAARAVVAAARRAGDRRRRRRRPGPLRRGAARPDRGLAARPRRLGAGPARRGRRSAGLPTLGVCRGMQLMAVAAGGSLDQHTPDVVGHEQHSPGGDVFGGSPCAPSPAPGSPRCSATRSSRSPATTTSPCATHPGYVATAWADDGTVEAMEARRRTVPPSACSGTPRWPDQRPVRRAWSRGGRRLTDRRHDRPMAPDASDDRRPRRAVRPPRRIVLPARRRGPVVATLVRRAGRTSPTGRAVLYVHGFCDYFFQTEYAQWWADRGYDFYALDLRKYGRSLRQHQTPNYVTDLHEYFEDLDAAWQPDHRRDGHDHVVVGAHSTGGLHRARCGRDRRRPGRCAALVLNSPWLDMQGTALDAHGRHRRHPAASAGAGPCGAVAAHDQRLLRPQPAPRRTGASGTSTSPGSRSTRSRSTSAGWRAIRRGHAELHARARRARARCWCCPPARTTLAQADGARTCTATTSCSTSSRSAAGRRPSAGTSPSSSIHGRPARRGAVPPRRPRAGLRRARPLGHGVRRDRRHRPQRWPTQTVAAAAS